MDATEVQDHVLTELGEKRENKFGWNFENHLVNPPVQYSYEESNGSTSVYWVVLIESENGYHILFDESDAQFGLATSGVVVGWYGDLMSTIDGM